MWTLLELYKYSTKSPTVTFKGREENNSDEQRVCNDPSCAHQCLIQTRLKVQLNLPLCAFGRTLILSTTIPKAKKITQNP